MAGRLGKQAETAEASRRPRGALPYLLLFLVLQVAAYAVVLRVVQPDTPGREVSFDQLNLLLARGQLDQATVLDYDSRITSRDARGDFWVALPRGELAVNQMSGALAAGGVETTIDQQAYKGTLNFLAQFLLPVLLFFTMFGVLFLLFTGPAGLGGLSLFGKSKARRFQRADDQLTFADVAGLDETIAELAEVKDFLKAPERFVAMGARVPKGVLLVGPPGCGKTMLAKALAGEAGVPFFSIAGSEFVEMLVGVGAARVRDLFSTARAAAPAIIFIDELDAVGRARSSATFGGANEERDQTLNEMLVQMDGFGPETGLVVLTATNRADILDEALTRPGRFDRHIVVDLPDQAGRESILAVHLRGKPIAPDVDVTEVARRTPGFSGADLANVINEGALLAARRNLATIGRAEIEEGIDRALSGPERRNRLLTARDKHIVAVHEAGHTLVGWLLPGADPVEKVSVVARGMSLGHTRTVPTEETKLLTRSQLVDRITTALAGRLAEIEVFSESSTGAAKDLVVATDLARQMVFDLGMGDGVATRHYGPSATVEGRALSTAVADELDRAITALLREAEDTARRLLREQRSWLNVLVAALEERETLHRDDIAALLSGLTQPVAEVPIVTEPAVAAGPGR